MDKIVCIDDFLTHEELTQAIDIINKKGWHFGHKSKHTDKIETPFWSMTLDDEPFFTHVLKAVIEKTVMKKLVLNRVYANGQTFGQDGAFHTDDDDPNAYSFVLYLAEINPQDQDAAGGYFCVKLPENNFTMCYEPKFNRGMFFPSNYTHRACSFTRYVMDLRIAVAWKLCLAMEADVVNKPI